MDDDAGCPLGGPFDLKMRCFYLRVERRQYRKKAIVVIALKMLISVYYVLRRRMLYFGDAVERAYVGMIKPSLQP